MNKTTKNVLTGMAVGFIANGLGILLFVLFFSKYSVPSALEDMYEKGYLGALIGLGGVLNLLAFFGFLRLKQDERAKGVLLASFVLAFIILVLQFK